MLSWRKKNQHGFSLMEVMVAAGLMGGMSLYILTLTQNVQKVQKDLELTQDKITVMQNLNLIATAENCGLGTELNKIDIPDKYESYAPEVTQLVSSTFPLKVGDKIGGLRLDKIVLGNFVKSASDNTTFFADIQLHLYKGHNANGGEYFNPQKSKVTVALTQNPANNQIESCTTIQEAAEVAKTCATLGLPLAADGKTCVPNPLPKENIYLSAAFCAKNDANCKSKTAMCDEGDLAIAGDCYGGYHEGVQGDLVLSLPPDADCSGCPKDKNKCDDACLVFEYTGFGCNYYGGTAATIAEKGARILCMKRPKEEEIHVSQVKGFSIYSKAMQTYLKNFSNQNSSIAPLAVPKFTLPQNVILKRGIQK